MNTNKTPKQNDLTELVFILDRSGSMSGLASDTVGGFNSMLAKQKKEPGKAYVSTILFNENSEVLHDRVPLDQVPEMTEADYTPYGCTALLDAVGEAVRHIGNIHKYARPEDVPAHTLFIITTDGMENASRRWQADAVKQLIEQQKKRYGWEFLFIGANIDAVSVASHMGISADRTANYRADRQGTATLWNALYAPMCDVRACRSIGREWSETLEQDKKSR